jgi:hypothetical protein
LKDTGTANSFSTQMVKETSPLVDPSAIASVATAGASFVNAASSKIKKERAEGPLTFRVYVF